MNRILPIVEGDGDLKAVPVLLRKLLDHHELHEIQLLSPQKRGELPKGFAYKPTVHQAKISARLDLASLRQTSANFRHLEKALLHLAHAESPRHLSAR